MWSGVCSRREEERPRRAGEAAESGRGGVRGGGEEEGEAKGEAKKGAAKGEAEGEVAVEMAEERRSGGGAPSEVKRPVPSSCLL